MWVRSHPRTLNPRTALHLNGACVNETIRSLIDKIKYNLKGPEKVMKQAQKVVKIYHMFVNSNLMRLKIDKIVYWNLLIIVRKTH